MRSTPTRPGFTVTRKAAIDAIPGQSVELTIPLHVSDVNQQVTVEADATNSVANPCSPPLDTRLDSRSARTEISDHYIQNVHRPHGRLRGDHRQNSPGAFRHQHRNAPDLNVQDLLPRPSEQTEHHLRRHTLRGLRRTPPRSPSLGRLPLAQAYASEDLLRSSGSASDHRLRALSDAPSTLHPADLADTINVPQHVAYGCASLHTSSPGSSDGHRQARPEWTYLPVPKPATCTC